MTVRRAVDELRTEGLLISEHGRGVFVRTAPPVHRITSDRFARQSTAAEESDNSPHFDSIAVTLEKANSTVAEHLRLTPGEMTSSFDHSATWPMDAPSRSPRPTFPPLSPAPPGWITPTSETAASTRDSKTPATSWHDSPKKSAPGCPHRTSVAPCTWQPDPC